MSLSLRRALGYEARNGTRRGARLVATLRTTTDERSVVMLNLSAGGALLDAADPPAPGDRVVLLREPAAVPGRIGWVNGNRFGIAFDRPVSEDDIRRMMHTAKS